jgi:hypothetical protein
MQRISERYGGQTEKDSNRAQHIVGEMLGVRS